LLTGEFCWEYKGELPEEEVSIHTRHC